MSSISSVPVHRYNVCKLYKTILRLHRGLPDGMKDLGDKYVKDEFRLHQTIKNDEQIKRFMLEWTDYAMVLSKQLSSSSLVKSVQLGKELPVEKLNAFSDDQVLQLYELKTELQRIASRNGDEEKKQGR